MQTVTLAELVRTYVFAKDMNRPHLVPRVFSSRAAVEMILKTDAIAFSPRADGPEEIAGMLVRRFCEQYENVYTFCLCSPPPASAEGLDVGWLVLMSERQTQRVRAGFGRYRWEWRPEVERLVQRLCITIERMDSFEPSAGAAAFAWAQGLPYPWCPIDRLVGAPLPLQALIRDAAVAARC